MAKACFPERVMVMHNDYGEHMSYAADLAQILHIPLSVYAPTKESLLIALKESYEREPWQLRAVIHSRLFREARTLFATPAYRPIETHIESPVNDRSSLIVSCDTWKHFGAPCLSPAGERKVFRGESKGPVFIPFGDGASSIISAKYGALIAKQLGTTVILWHTTWRNENAKSSDPHDHMTPEATTMQHEVESLLRIAGVPFQTECVCVPKLVEGLIKAALHMGAPLIVMAEGAQKEFGTYASHVRDRNCPIPLLVIPKGIS